MTWRPFSFLNIKTWQCVIFMETLIIIPNFSHFFLIFFKKKLLDFQ